MKWQNKLKFKLFCSFFFRINYFENKLAKVFNKESVNINLFHSCRVALWQLAIHIKSTQNIDTVYLPKYICNVVYLAFQKAEFKILTYETNSNLEIENFDEFIADKTHTVILLASIYGSSANYLEANKSNVIAHLSNNNIKLIFDFAQNFTLLDKLTFKSKDIFSVTSFNDKQTPGLMLGALFCKEKIMPNYIKCSEIQKQKLKEVWKDKFNVDIKKITYESINKEKFYDFSFGKQFPWNFVNTKPIKKQIVIALFGAENLHLFKKNRKIQNFNNFMQTFAYKSPYIIVSPSLNLKGFTLKMPYAKPNNEFESFRSDLNIIHNKGFWE